MKNTYAIGIDVGGTSLKYGLADKNGRLHYSSLLSIAGASSEQEVIDSMISAVNDCVKNAGSKSVIKGIGIGFPGIVANNKVLGGADNLPGFTNVALDEIMLKATGLKTIADNDANMMAWGEVMYGAARGGTDVVFLTIGTGIGGSLVINGNLYGGYNNRGTELGHIVIKQNGRHCSCGGAGCLEAYASVSALVHDYMALKPDAGLADGKLITDLYLAGDKQAVQVMKNHFTYMAAGVVSFINVFSPQKVVLGGGITEAGDFYIDQIKERVAKTVMPETAKYTLLVAAGLGNKAGLLGCTGRVFSQLK